MRTSFRTAAAASAIALMCAGGASASTMTTLINFDGLVGSDTSVTQDGYLVAPLNIQGGNCFERPCTIESGQETLPTVIRVEEPFEFTLNSFWVLFSGNGTVPSNFLRVEAFTGEGPDGYTVVKTLEFGVSGGTEGHSIPSTFAAVAAAGATVAYDPGQGGTATGSATERERCTTVDICRNVGYKITLTDPLFSNVTQIKFTDLGSANARLDDISLSREVAPIPLPAAGWLLLGGLGALAAVRRRKQAA